MSRQRLEDEGRRLVAFAKRNPLTIAAICIGLAAGVWLLHGVEGRIGHVERKQTVVEQRVVRISTCAAKPHSQACLRGITTAVRRCLADPTCHNLIAGAEIIAVPAPKQPRAGPPAPSTESPVGTPEQAGSPQDSPGPSSPAPSGGGHQHHQKPPHSSPGAAQPSPAPSPAPEAPEAPANAPGGAPGASGEHKSDVAVCVLTGVCVEAEAGAGTRITVEPPGLAR